MRYIIAALFIASAVATFVPAAHAGTCYTNCYDYFGTVQCTTVCS